ncbi:hypothetical protein F2A38_16980 [Pseudomonas chlororaphis]|uniref:Uncharacterized protein n=1 Tax=Pseudomonas chlororaphis TaxID=587753 RepID=A0AB34C3F4_9PSED|nr:hypothetical protein F2A38_16980 [Pseudomonas chlororaphis]
MKVNNDACCLDGCVVLGFIASKLAPTGGESGWLAKAVGNLDIGQWQVCVLSVVCTACCGFRLIEIYM